MLQWGQERALRCHILLSKADKLSQSEAAKTLREVRGEVQAHATAQLFSATTSRGVDDARRVLDEVLRQKNTPVA
jgi:GTP-binding protein